MTLAVMTRATLGHAGRALAAGHGDDRPLCAGDRLGAGAAARRHIPGIGAVALDPLRHPLVRRLCGIRAPLRTLAGWFVAAMSRGIDRGGRSQARRNRGVRAEGRPSPPGDGIMTADSASIAFRRSHGCEVPKGTPR